MDYPRLATPIICALISTLALSLAWKESGWPDWVRIVLVGIGGLMLFVAAVTLINWIVANFNERLLEYHTAMAHTERTAMLDTISHMSAEQVAILNQYVPVVEILAGLPGPIYRLVTPTGTVPQTFIDEFLIRSTDEYLAPIRSWSDGSNERQWAENFTQFLIVMGNARQASGPHPAAWVDKNGALKSIGIIK